MASVLVLARLLRFCQLLLPHVAGAVAVEPRAEDEVEDLRVPGDGLAFDAVFDVLPRVDRASANSSRIAKCQG